METPSSLVQVKLTHSEETPVVEVFRTPTPGDFWDDDYDTDAGWNTDSEGSGLILYLYKGNRTWVKTSVSKTPFAFLKKALLTEADSPYLTSVLVVRGTTDYPLTDKEIKNLAGMLNNRFKDTPLASFTSYTTVSDETPETHRILSNLLNDVVDTVTELGFNTTQTVKPEPEEPLISDVKSGNETVVLNGVRVTVQTKLADENNPERGLGFASVRLTDVTGKTIIYSSTGTSTTDV